MQWLLEKQSSKSSSHQPSASDWPPQLVAHPVTSLKSGTDSIARPFVHLPIKVLVVDVREETLNSTVRPYGAIRGTAEPDIFVALDIVVPCTAKTVDGLKGDRLPGRETKVLLQVLEHLVARASRIALALDLGGLEVVWRPFLGWVGLAVNTTRQEGDRTVKFEIAPVSSLGGHYLLLLVT